MTKRILSVLLSLMLVLPMCVAPAFAEAAGGGSIALGYYNLADYESAAGTKIESFNQAPMFDARVESGELPPVEERLPENPLVTKTLNSVGNYGGTLREASINIDQDWHMRHLNAANTIECPADPAWDAVSSLYGVPFQPGILEAFGMNEDGTVFSGTIRKGLKWSDGVPVTTRDVEFKFKDHLLNKTMHPVANQWLTWGGGQTELIIVDEQTFQYKFASPYGSFIEAEVFMWPGVYSKHMLPAHYLERYHIDYADPDELLETMKVDNYGSLDEWKEFFGKKVNLFGCDNPYLDQGHSFPTLNAWVVTEDLGNGSYRWERNPYYYIVDEAGNQLPYIDKVDAIYVTDEEMQNMSIITGEVDVSCMTIGVENYPLFKEHEADGNYRVLPLPDYLDQVFVFGFNANAGIKPPTLTSVDKTELDTDVTYDEGLAAVYGDVRFRRAMSIALDRNVFNDTLFLGLGRPAQVAPRPGTPFYKEGMEEAYAQYDPEGAKALLDEMGMIDTDGDGWRERPDGKPFKMMYEYFIITAASTPGSELCKRFWEDVGVRVELKLVDANFWWANLQPNNVNEATTWWLSGSGANLLQDWFLGPSMLVPLWNRYSQYKTAHETGEISDEDWENVLKYVPEWQREMQDLKRALKVEADPDKRNEIATRMWEIQAEYLPIMGVVTESSSPLVINADLGNVEDVYEMGLNYIAVMEQAEQWYFKSDARLGK